MSLHFIRPGWLLLAPLAVALWWLWQRRSDPLRGWREQIAPDLLEALVVGRESIKSGNARWLLVAWLVAIVAIAGPTWRLEPSPFADDVTPLMILLKADVSMMQPDPAPSRLERARLKIADLGEARKGQPLGLIAYAGSAHLVLPPTRDTATVAQMAAEISPDIMPISGDRLDLALREAVRVLAEGQSGGSIVVLADAVDTDPAALAALRKEFSIPVQFLAINAPESSQSDSLRAAAKTLGADVEQIDVEGKDIAAIVRHAASAPIAKRGQQGERWQEAGYWLVPLIGLIVLASFRREESEEESA
ncbi:MAG: VWA domain-containing protein [Burkholderiaceae bacterium]|jgi:Ca-activated chloride channel family protein|nr:VWA domain-containing protein [Burkholderiaceae bacterium]